MSSSRADLLLGGRYRLGVLLGSGGMADVYEGIDERLGRRVAVKLLRPEMSAREDVRQRFEAEARSAASLSHPNVVGVFDTGEDGDTPYIVMERLPGETVADRMREGPLNHSWTLQMARDVLAALAAAHAAGIVHRDVKPGNVLIADDGRTKVADFGIAKSVEVAAAADLTGTNQIMGTPAYVAPERILGQPATPQADLYAVGVVLYEALAGKKPFSGDTPVATAYAIQHETPPPLAEIRPDLPDEVVSAVERSMARDPRDRFGSAAEMAAALGLPGGAAALAPGAGDATVAAPMMTDAGSTQVLPATPPATDVPPSPVGGTRRSLGPVSNVAAVLGDRRRMLLVGGIALLVLLFVAIVAAATGAKDDPDERSSSASELAADLREEAEGLDDSDGSAAAEAAEALRVTANFVENGGGGPEATALLAKLAGWRDSGQLAAPTVDRLAGLLGEVPGVDPSALTPPTTASPPTTAAPKDEDDKEEEEKKDDGKGKGKD